MRYPWSALGHFWATHLNDSTRLGNNAMIFFHIANLKCLLENNKFKIEPLYIVLSYKATITFFRHDVINMKLTSHCKCNVQRCAIEKGCLKFTLSESFSINNYREVCETKYDSGRSRVCPNVS